jgi:DnaJ-class molecular chaperone
MIGLIPQGYEGYDVEGCPHCAGSGRQVWGLYDTLYTDDCETCDGEGVVPA